MIIIFCLLKYDQNVKKNTDFKNLKFKEELQGS